MAPGRSETGMFHHGHEEQQPPQQYEPVVASPHRYQVRERLLAIGDDYDIKDERGQRVFHVDGKVLRLRHTLLFEDAQGREIYTIQGRLLRLRESMAIEHGGRKVAEVHKAAVAPIRERLEVDVAGRQHVTVQGNLLDHEYEITQDGRLPIAAVSKKWFRVRDTYGVEVAPAQDDALMLTIAICVDAMRH